jgi:hypothetical protein
MSRLELSFACWDYDRVKALQDGTVRPEGIDLNFLSLRVEETFYRALRNHEFDACELSLSSWHIRGAGITATPVSRHSRTRKQPPRTCVGVLSTSATRACCGS